MQKHMDLLNNTETTMKTTNVIVKVSNDYGKSCLNEIHPRLNEGDVVRGQLYPNGAFKFKWQGNDAVLWLGMNCEKTKKRKVVN